MHTKNTKQFEVKMCMHMGSKRCFQLASSQAATTGCHGRKCYSRRKPHRGLPSMVYGGPLVAPHPMQQVVDLGHRI
jgi:hypothetical protein